MKLRDKVKAALSVVPRTTQEITEAVAGKLESVRRELNKLVRGGEATKSGSWPVRYSRRSVESKAVESKAVESRAVEPKAVEAPPMARIPGEPYFFEGDLAKAREYILAGKATFTVTNTETGRHFTYKVSRAKAKPGQPADKRPWFVRILSGSDNTSDYRYCGKILPARSEAELPRFFWKGEWANRKAGKSPLDGASTGVKAFAWTFARIVRGNLPSKIRLNHYGACGRCGRTLTDSRNFELHEEYGWLFGPICREKMGLPA